jgi:hypothetical protein
MATDAKAKPMLKLRNAEDIKAKSEAETKAKLAADAKRKPMLKLLNN